MQETESGLFLEEEEETEESSQAGNETIQQIRQAARRNERGKKAAEKRAADLSLEVARFKFEKAGLASKLADMYVKTNPEFDPVALTSEDAAKFATELGIEVKAPETKPGEAPEAKTEGTPEAKPGEQQEEQQQEPAPTPPTPVQTLPGNTPSPVAVKTAEIWEAVNKGDMAKVAEIVQKEITAPGTIEYKHPEHVKDIE